MRRRLIITETAEAEAEQAILWYRDIDPALALSFRTALRAALARIAQAPLQCPPAGGAFRKLLLRRFPYLVVFRTNERETEVIAIFHTARDPAAWRRRH